ncbi:MAG: MlaD family protein [Fibrobacterota bacterium]
MTRNTKNNLLVGSVIIISLVILVWGVVWLKEYNFNQETHDIIAVFENVGTLGEGDPVKINGVKKGKVHKIRLVGRNVETVLRVDKSVKIPVDSKIVVQNIGLMGERMIGVTLGESPTFLTGSDKVQGYFDSGVAEAMGMLGNVLFDAKQLVVFIRSLVNETVGDEAFLQTFSDVVRRLDRLTVTVEVLVAGNERILNDVVRDVKTSSDNVKAIIDDNSGKINSAVDNFAEASDRTRVLLGRIDTVSVSLERIIGKVENGQGSVAMLLNDPDFYMELKSTVNEADSLLKIIKTEGLDLNVDLW